MNDKPSSAKLADLLVEIAERMEQGDSLDIGSLASELGEELADLEEMLPTVEHLIDLGRKASSSIYLSSRNGVMAGEALGFENHRLDDFRLIREVGRGGMGVVYEAEQVSLNRRVAVKLLPGHAALDKRQRQRFQLEAQAAARLRHPHIVSVYAIGIDQGAHYFAMQFIDGCSLADMIAGLRQDRVTAYFDVTPRMNDSDQARFPEAEPSDSQIERWQTTIPAKHTREYFQFVARIGQQVAEALDHAHQQQIVHRDIKPGNLMLDTSGWVWVTDFGLAQSAGQEGLTVTGDIVGTLRYMSPEQALGKRGVVDQRTDIYSLGVTLYELLRLEPAFSGERGEVLRQIETDQPPSLRRDPRIPRDLVTIINKATEKNPQDRYQTALEMSEDFRRFRAGEPILAAPISLWQQFRRWSHRRQSTLLVLTFVAVLSAVVCIVGWVVTRNALDGERKANQLAQRRELEAHAIVQSTFLKILGENHIYDPQFETLQNSFEKKAEAYLERLLRDNKKSRPYQSNIACALAQLGMIRQRQGRFDDAISLYRQSFDQYVQLVAISAEPERSGYREHAAEVNSYWVRCLGGTNRFTEAKKAAEQGRKIAPHSWKIHATMARLLATSPKITNPDLQRGRQLAAETIRMEPNAWEPQTTLGLVCLRLGDYDKARDAFRHARQRSSHEIPLNRYLLAVALVKAGHMEEARAVFGPLKDYHTKVLRQNPDIQRWREVVSVLLRATPRIN